MKSSEYFEKYWVVTLPDGTKVNLKLSDYEKKIFDLAKKLGVPAYIKTGGRRSRFKYIVHPEIQKAIDKQELNIF